MSTGLHTVHVRVNDAATGQPTPCRVRFADADGRYFPPLGRLADFATGPNQDVGGNLCLQGTKYAYIDGACEVPLPSTPVRVEIRKGPEYEPLLQEVALGPGKLALRFELKRWLNLRQEAWYSGDLRACCLSPHAALLEAAAEDLAVVNLLASDAFEVRSTHGTLGTGEAEQRYPTIPNLLAFSGQQPALEVPGHLVAVNTQNSHPVLGSLALLHCHRPVYPLSFGGPEGWDHWTLADWCDQCHRKNGLVVWLKQLRTSGPAISKRGEPLADLVLGKVDAFECRGDFSEWHQLLNAGLRVPVIAGSAKDSNGEALGGWRTYARLLSGEPFTYRTWIEAVRAGRTFVSSGPILRLTVNGQQPGGVVDLSDAEVTVHVRAECRSLTSLAQVQVLANGVVVSESESQCASAEADVSLPEGGWIAALCQAHDAAPGERVCAHTSPVYVRVQGRGPRPDTLAVKGLIADLDRMLDWVRYEARCETEKQRNDLAHIFEDARQNLLRRQDA